MSDPVLRLADSYIPRFARTFERSATALQNRVTVELVTADLELGLTNEPRNLLALVDGIEVAKAEDGVFAGLLAEAARLELKGQALRQAMTVQSPFVQQAARKLAGNLVTGVKEQTKKAIRRLIFEAIRDGDAPARAQRTIRRAVGLTARDALALKRYETAQRAAATTRRLQGLAERRVDRYGRRLLRDRALNIARTETIRAGNTGRQVAWRQMANDSLIDTRNFRQQWLATGDDRLCEICAPMDGKQVDLGSSFESTQRGVLPSERVPVAGDTVESPPLHPRCRCTLVAAYV